MRSPASHNFFARNNALSDDHLPFMRIGVPCADIIDIDYGYNNVFHHTVQDTVDKLSVKSLNISGGVIDVTGSLTVGNENSATASHGTIMMSAGHGPVPGTAWVRVACRPHFVHERISEWS